MSAILGPTFKKMEIRYQIRNQRPQKPWSTKLHENRWVSIILCSPYWVCHFEFWRSDVEFIISDPKSFWVQSFAVSCSFQNCMSDILDIRHFAKGMAIWDRWDNRFLVVQLFRSPLIIGRIKSQYSLARKKIMKKKIPDFLVLFFKFGAILDFLLDKTQFGPRILEKHTH